MCFPRGDLATLVRKRERQTVPAVEILLNTSLIADLIKNTRSQRYGAIEKSVSAGSQTFDRHCTAIQAGQITKERPMRQRDSASNLSTLIDFSKRTNHHEKPVLRSPSAHRRGATQFCISQRIKLNLDDPRQMKLYGIPNCNTVKKARDWLVQHDIEFGVSRLQETRRHRSDARDAEADRWQSCEETGPTWDSLPDAVKASITNDAPRWL